MVKKGLGVLIYRFLHYYSGIARPTDQGSPAIEEIVCYIHKSQETGSHHVRSGHTGEVLGSVRRQGEMGKHEDKPLLWFLRKEQVIEG